MADSTHLPDGHGPLRQLPTERLASAVVDLYDAPPGPIDEPKLELFELGREDVIGALTPIGF